MQSDDSSLKQDWKVYIEVKVYADEHLQAIGRRTLVISAHRDWCSYVILTGAAVVVVCSVDVVLCD